MELVVVHFDLHCQDLRLFCADFQLVGLAVERQALQGVDLAWLNCVMLSGGSDEGKFNVWIKIRAAVAEGQLELLDSVDFLHCQRDDHGTCGLVEKLAHAFDHWVVKEAKKKDLNLACNGLFLEDHPLFLVRHMLLFCLSGRKVFNLNLNKGNDASLQLVFRCLDYNDKLLCWVWLHFHGKLFLKFLRCRVFNVPAVKFWLWILYHWTVTVLKWKLFSIVLAENLIASVTLLLWNWKLYTLFRRTQVCQKQSWSKNFSANELTIINYIRVDFQELSNLNGLNFFLLMCQGLEFILWTQDWLQFKIGSWWLIQYFIFFLNSVRFDVSRLDVFLVFFQLFILEVFHSLQRRLRTALQWTTVLGCLSVDLRNIKSRFCTSPPGSSFLWWTALWRAYNNFWRRSIFVLTTSLLFHWRFHRTLLGWAAHFAVAWGIVNREYWGIRHAHAHVSSLLLYLIEKLIQD